MGVDPGQREKRDMTDKVFKITKVDKLETSPEGGVESKPKTESERFSQGFEELSYMTWLLRYIPHRHYPEVQCSAKFFTWMINDQDSKDRIHFSERSKAPQLLEVDVKVMEMGDEVNWRLVVAEG